jgi:hypothetical protein
MLQRMSDISCERAHSMVDAMFLHLLPHGMIGQKLSNFGMKGQSDYMAITRSHTTDGPVFEYTYPWMIKHVVLM